MAIKKNRASSRSGVTGGESGGKDGSGYGFGEDPSALDQQDRPHRSPDLPIRGGVPDPRGAPELFRREVGLLERAAHEESNLVDLAEVRRRRKNSQP